MRNCLIARLRPPQWYKKGEIERIGHNESGRSMESVLSQDYQLLSGYAMPIFGLGTWQLSGSTCERIVVAAKIVDDVYT